MRVCQKHWAVMRKAIDDRGMSGLVDKDGHAAMDRMVSELNGEPQGDDFDPLMSMNWHWHGQALAAGGLYLMTKHDGTENDGHYCPICEFEKHSAGFDAERDIGVVADQMRAHAMGRGLIPSVS